MKRVGEPVGKRICFKGWGAEHTNYPMVKKDNTKGPISKDTFTLGDVGEFGFIRSIQDDCHFATKGVIRGIGDDCAVVGPYDGRVLLITTDLLLEDVHFLLERIPAHHLGHKAAAVNLSDIAAMGGTARYLFLSLAAPGATPLDTVHRIYAGIKALCRTHSVSLLGGDTSASRDRLLISVTAIGDTPADEVVYRSGAGKNDGIYVTGTLGDAAAGLRLIREEISGPQDVSKALTAAHNQPVPHLEAGRMIAHSRTASAMIDLSDGLLPDLGHICEASGVGASLFRSALPLSNELKTIAHINGVDPYDLAIRGGEDYRLLVTVPRSHTEAFEQLFADGAPCRVYRVGEVTEQTGIRLMDADGTEHQLTPTGFDHFRPTTAAQS